MTHPRFQPPSTTMGPRERCLGLAGTHVGTGARVGGGYIRANGFLLRIFVVRVTPRGVAASTLRTQLVRQLHRFAPEATSPNWPTCCSVPAKTPEPARAHEAFS
jgi:hypothetical protein